MLTYADVQQGAGRDSAAPTCLNTHTHTSSAAVQQQACGALLFLSEDTRYRVYLLYWYKSTKTDAAGLASLRQRITTAGCVERVILAMNAVNATATTQKWGQEILVRLRWLE